MSITMVVTHFHDMYSGGRLKTRYKHIYVEADEERARKFFRRHFHREADNVTCTCCGPDFSVTTHEATREESDLLRATAYERNCKFVTDSTVNGGGYYVEEPRTLALTDRTLTRESLDTFLDRDDIAYFDAKDVAEELD